MLLDAKAKACSQLCLLLGSDEGARSLGQLVHYYEPGWP